MDVVNIDVDGPEVTDAMLERLAGLPQLQRMYFRGTRITDAGIEHLVGLSRLEEITLSDSQVTDAGVAKLQKALPNCKIIR